MKIEYALDKKDFLIHQLFAASQSQRIKRKRMRNWLLPPALYIAAGLLLMFLLTITYLFAFACIALVWLLFYPFYARYLYRQHYARHIDEHYKNRIGRRATLEFDEKALVITDESSESKLQYSEIAGITGITSHIFIGLKTDASIIIPRDKIATDDLGNVIALLTEKTGVRYTDIGNWKWK